MDLCVGEVGCARAVRYPRIRLCGMHYQRMQTRGDFGRTKRIYPSLEELWSSLERLGSRAAVAEELGVKLSAFKSHLCRKNLDSKFYAREREIKLALLIKVCSKCKREFPRTLEYFYAHPVTRDGLTYVCKSCQKISSSAVRETRSFNPGSATRYALVMKISPEETRLLSDYRKVILLDPCVYCGKPAEAGDHIVPLSRRGEHSWQNMAPVCTPCNSAKRDKSLLQFMLVRANQWDRVPP